MDRSCGHHVLLWIITAISTASVTTNVVAEETIPDLLAVLDIAQQRIDRFECQFSWTEQLYGSEPLKCEGALTRHLWVTDPSQWPPARTSEHHVLVDGERYWFQKVWTGRNGLVTDTEAWDGLRSIGQSSTKDYMAISSKPSGTPGVSAFDPRALAWRPTPTTSLIDDLRKAYQESRLSVSVTVLDDRPMRLFDVAPDEDNQRGYQIWVDPTRGYLPVRIDWYSGSSVIYRYHQIEHVKINDNLWFPVTGRVDVFVPARHCSIHAGQQVSSSELQVDVESINLAPTIGSDTFTLTTPPGTLIYDWTGDEEQVYVASASSTMKDAVGSAVQDARTMASEAVAEVAAAHNGSPADANRLAHSDARQSSRGLFRARMGPAFLVWLGSLAMVGFLTSWLLTRRNGAR